MKKNKLFLLISLFLLGNAMAKAQFISPSSIDFRLSNLDTLEKYVPCYYSLDWSRATCDEITVVELNEQLNFLDSLTIRMIDQIEKYYQKNGQSGSDIEIKGLYDQWLVSRKTMSNLYMRENDGSGRGGTEVAYLRDITKLFLISILPILSATSE